MGELLASHIIHGIADSGAVEGDVPNGGIVELVDDHELLLS